MGLGTIELGGVVMAPIQRGRERNQPDTYVPWWLAEIAYADYARRYGTQQTLLQLCQRGGFGREELLEHLRSELNRRGTYATERGGPTG